MMVADCEMNASDQGAKETLKRAAERGSDDTPVERDSKRAAAEFAESVAKPVKFLKRFPRPPTKSEDRVADDATACESPSTASGSRETDDRPGASTPSEQVAPPPSAPPRWTGPRPIKFIGPQYKHRRTAGRIWSAKKRDRPQLSPMLWNDKGCQGGVDEKHFLSVFISLEKMVLLVLGLIVLSGVERCVLSNYPPPCHTYAKSDALEKLADETKIEYDEIVRPLPRWDRKDFATVGEFYEKFETSRRSR